MGSSTATNTLIFLLAAIHQKHSINQWSLAFNIVNFLFLSFYLKFFWTTEGHCQLKSSFTQAYPNTTKQLFLFPSGHTICMGKDAG